MEDKDKKRRPRIAKSDSAPEFTDRGENDTPDNQNEGDFSERKPYSDRPNYQDREGGGGYERKPYGDRPNYPNREGGGGGGGGYERKPYGDRPNYPNREGGGGGGYERKPYGDRPNYQNREGGGGGYERKPYGGGGKFNNRGGGGFGRKPARKKDDFYLELKPKAEFPTGEGMPLNKYLAHCGIASRRKAVELIESGSVLVNGEAKMEPYYRIQAADVVTCDGKPLKVQEKMVYVLLNKPKNVITSTEDERGRYTVLDIVDPNYPERIYPVGRLDRDTTGLILLTNDGDLAQKLMHPSYRIQKQYRVGLRRPLEAADMELIRTGVKLEDGVVEVNWIRFSEEHPEGDIVELEITSGRNRVIRRLFEALDYEVFKLDRFYFAGLTKKDLARGSFRDLTPREIIMLKHFTGHPSTTKKMLDTNQTDSDAIDVDDDVEDDGFSEEGDKD